jgi:TonB-linked SusC/RagA family outer membrane protein
MEIKLKTAIFFSRRKLLMIIMRTFIFLCFTTVFGFSPNILISQNSKIKIEEDKILTVDEVFDIIMEQTDYKFIYQEGIFKDFPKIKVSKGVIRTNKLLEQSITTNNFSFSLTENNTIVIKVKPMSARAGSSSGVEVQQRQVSGKVTDMAGLPIPGVTVLIKGTNKGAITDFDGNYIIMVPNSENVLVFSFLGFETQEIKVGNKTVIDVVFKEAVSTLEEVTLVSTGFYSIPKERATGSFSNLEQEQIDVPASSVAERLSGMVSGLHSNINADGSIDFEIRGQTSLLADQKPLIVYDGFPIEGDFSSINPNDIDNVVVLKDAAAASIWGAKSGNGVIVITSKSAKRGEVKISGSSFVRFSDKLDLDYVNPLASSAEVIEYEQRGFDSNMFGGPFQLPSASIQNLGPYSLAVTAMNEVRLGRMTPAERDAILSRLSNSNNKEQIEKYMLQFPIITQYNVNVSGGNERMGNYLSLLYENNKDYYKGNNADKFLIQYKNNIEVTDWLDFNFSGLFNYTERKNNGVNLTTIKSLAPYDMLANEDGSLTDMSYLNYYMPNFNQFIPSGRFPYSDWSHNPISDIENRDLLATELHTRLQTGLTLKLMEGLSLSSTLQYEMLTLDNNNYYKEESSQVRRFINETSQWNRSNVTTNPVQLVPFGGVLQQNRTKIEGYNFRNQLNFTRTFAEKHAINAIIGSEISNKVTEFTRNPDAFGYNDDRLTTGALLKPLAGARNWFNSSLSNIWGPFNLAPTHTFTYNIDRFFSLYGNAAYTFDRKYTISGSYRTDASNLITDDPKYRFSPFWSVGLGWQIAQESFMQDQDWLNKLNFRFSYGYNGNVDRSTSFRPLINIPGTLNQYTQETIGSISSYGNPTLRWEKTNTINLGFDFSVLNNKLYGTFEVYKKRGEDLIVSQNLPSIVGTSEQRLNTGKMLNEGLEVSLGTSLPLKGNDIIWDGSVNFSYNKNEITEFFRVHYAVFNLTGGGTSSYVEGYNANTLWALRYAGMTNVGTETDPNMQPSFYGENDENYTFQNSPPSGVDARTYISDEGTTVAPITAGMRNSFKIYDFNFSFIITGKFGHVFRRQSFNYPEMAGGNTYVNTKYGEVVNSNPEEIVPIPGQDPRYYTWRNFYPYLNYLTADASHIRFQEINLTYSLPKSIVNQIGVNSIKVYAMANDIGTILFNDFGEDPEYPRGTLKPMSKYTLGLNFTF